MDNGRSSPLKHVFTAALAVWGILLALNFIGPRECIDALVCIPAFLRMLADTHLSRLPWLGLIVFVTACISLWGWGMYLGPWLGIRNLTWLISLVIGIAVLASILSGFGMSGLFLPAIWVPLWLVGLVLAGRAIPRRMIKAGLANRLARSWLDRVLDSITLGFVLLALADASAPEWFPDAVFQHFALPEQYGIAHRIFPSTYEYSSCSPPGYACLLGTLLPAGGWRTLKAFQWGVMVLAAFASGGLAFELWGSRTAAAAARALFASLPLVGQLAGHGQTDIPVALSACAAATALLRWRKGMGAGWLAVGAAAMCAGLNCKLTAPLYWAVLALALPGGRMPLRRSVLVWVVRAWALIVPWLCRNYYVVWNPVTPLFSSYIPTFGWDKEIERAAAKETGSFGFTGSFSERAASLWMWSKTERVLAEAGRLYGKAGLGVILLIAIPFVLFLRLPGWSRWVGYALFLVPAAWVFSIQAYRYLIPLAGLGAAVLAGGTTGIGGSVGRIMVTVALAQQVALWERIPWINPGPWLDGRVPSEVSVAGNPELDGIMRWTQSLPAKSRVVLCWTPSLFPAGCRVLSGGNFELPLFARWIDTSVDSEHLYRKARQAGATHLAVNVPVGLGADPGVWGREWVPSDANARSVIIKGFFGHHTRLVAARNEAVLYEVIRRGKKMAVPEPLNPLRTRDLGARLEPLSMALRRGAADDVARVLDGIMPLALESPFAAYRMGIAWAMIGRNATALNLLRRSAEAGYETGVVLRVMALCLERTGRTDEAGRLRQRAEVLDPEGESISEGLALMNQPFCMESPLALPERWPNQR